MIDLLRFAAVVADDSPLSDARHMKDAAVTALSGNDVMRFRIDVPGSSLQGQQRPALQ